MFKFLLKVIAWLVVQLQKIEAARQQDMAEHRAAIELLNVAHGEARAEAAQASRIRGKLQDILS